MADSRSGRVLVTIGVLVAWLGVVLLGSVLLSPARGSGWAVPGALLALVACGLPWVLAASYDEAPRLLVAWVIVLGALGLLVTNLLAEGVLVASGRDVPVVVADVRWCEVDCIPEVRLTNLSSRADLGWSGACGSEPLHAGDRITARTDRLGVFSARQKTCVDESPTFFRTAGAIVAAVLGVCVTYLLRLAYAVERYP